MKAVVKTGEDSTGYFTDYPEPSVSYGKVKVKVKAASICGSDVHFYYHDAPMNTVRYHYPVILGHEGAGVITEVGEGVEGYAPGDRVVSETTYNTCKKCEYCHEALYNCCSEREGLGSAVDGFFAEYIIADSNSLHLIPKNISYLQASVTEPLAVVCRGIFEQGDIRGGDVVVVYGPGPIGLLSAMVAKAQGCVVVLLGRKSSRKRLDYAKEALDIPYAFDIEENYKEIINGLTEGRGCDAVLECSGAPSAVADSIDLLKKRGQLICLGVTWDSFEMPYVAIAYEKELTIKGVRSTAPSSWDRALRLMRFNIIDTEKAVSKVLPMSEWKKGFRMMREREAIKIVLDPTK